MRALRIVAFALFPTLLLFGVFSLGFLGEPENDPWLTASPLWGPGDPFYFEEHELAHNLADPIMSFSPDPVSSNYMNHVYQAREGARGAEGGSGGGCGCN